MTNRTSVMMLAHLPMCRLLRSSERRGGGLLSVAHQPNDSGDCLIALCREAARHEALVCERFRWKAVKESYEHVGHHVSGHGQQYPRITRRLSEHRHCFLHLMVNLHNDI